MLYSVAICDILLKLQELRDTYNDTVANEILVEVEKCRNVHDNKSKSKWEKELIDSIKKKTDLLDLEAYTNISHLYDQRNFSAHPALNDDYELITPSRESTIAHIRDILNNVLIKPPVFIKNIVEMLTEDLKQRQHLYHGAFDELKTYLNNRYFDKMSDSMKKSVYKAFWKFCFVSPNDEDCQSNIIINRKALIILYEKSQILLQEYMKTETSFSLTSPDKNCVLHLTIFVSSFPEIYSLLSDDSKLQIDSLIDENDIAKVISWFKHKSMDEHLNNLYSDMPSSDLSENTLEFVTQQYKNIGAFNSLLSFYIEYFGCSRSFTSADKRYNRVIFPFIGEMTRDQLINLIQKINENTQLHNRQASYEANNEIMRVAKSILGDDFDYSLYTNFKFDSGLLENHTKDDQEDLVTIDEVIPF